MIDPLPSRTVPWGCTSCPTDTASLTPSKYLVSAVEFFLWNYSDMLFASFVDTLNWGCFHVMALFLVVFDCFVLFS